MRSTVCAFWHALAYFSYVYGTNAHRRLPEFRTLKKLWKERESQTCKLFRADKSQAESGLGDRRKLCNWMAEEIKVPNGKLHKGPWVPLRKFPAFTEFEDKHYAKRRRRMAKKAPKKAAKKVAKKVTKKVAKKAAAVKKTAKKPAGKKPAAKRAGKRVDLGASEGTGVATQQEIIEAGGIDPGTHTDHDSAPAQSGAQEAPVMPWDALPVTDTPTEAELAQQPAN
jgi:hypothetical protein